MNFFKFFLCFCLLCVRLQLSAQVYQPVDYTEPGRLYIPYREGNLWGYCDTTGRVLLPPQYDSLGFFDGWIYSAAIFKKEGKYGVLDNQFKEIISSERICLGLSTWSKKDLYIIVRDTSGTGVIDRWGYTIVPLKFDSVSFKFMMHGGYTTVAKAGKLGLYRHGDLHAAPEFDELFLTADFQETADMNGKIGRKNNRYFRIRPDGEQVELTDTTRKRRRLGSQQEYDAQHVDKIPIQQRERLITLTDSLRRTKVISRILFERAVGFREGRYEYVLAEKNKKVALLDIRNGKIYSGFYDDIVEFIDAGYVTLSEDGSGTSQSFSSLLLVRKGKKYGIVSLKGKEIFPFIFDGFGEITWLSIVTRQNNKEGLINLYTSYPVIPCKYDKISYHRLLRVNTNQLFTIYKVKNDGKTGYVGENGMEYFKDK